MKKKGMILICCAVAVIIAVVLIVVNVVIPGNKYKKATSMLESGDYVGAVEAFTALGDYKDSADQAASAQQEVDYQAAQELLDKEDYAGAVEAFSALGDYKDSKDQAASAQQEVDYQAAQELLDKEDYAGAVEAFSTLGDYKDSKDQAAEAQKELDFQIAQQNLEKYNSASAMAEIGSYSDAYKIYEDLGDYNDSPQKSEEMRTARFYEGKDLFNEKKYEKAYDVFVEVSEWTYHKDYAEIDEKEPEYWAAGSLFYMEKFDDAYNAFIQLGDYSDSADAAQACLNEPTYRDALALYEDEKYEDAKKAFDDLGDYIDSDSYSESCADHLTYNSLMDQLAEAEKMEEGSDDQKEKLKEIYDGFVKLGVFLDSQEQAYQIADKYFDEETKESVGMNSAQKAGETGLVVITSDTNIRAEAGMTGDVVGVVNAGTTVMQIGYTDGWVLIDYNGVQGYVRESSTEPASSVEYISKDSTVKITLPDNTWKVTQDADEMLVFSSGSDAMINIVHASTESAMKALSIQKTKEDLEAALTKQYSDSNAYEIQSFETKKVGDVDLYRYVVKYNAAARMWAYSVTYGVVAQDQAYVITGTMTDDNNALLEAVEDSVDSFSVLKDKNPVSSLSEEEELNRLYEFAADEIKTKFANANIDVRTGPSNEGDNIVSSLDKGEEIIVIGETANWYEIYKAEDSVSGLTDLKGFVMKNYLSDTYDEAMAEDASKEVESISMDNTTSNHHTSTESSSGERGYVSGVIVDVSGDSITLAADDGNSYTIDVGEAEISASEGLYDGLYVNVKYSTRLDGSISASTVIG